jgi:hypothetical protein
MPTTYVVKYTCKAMQIYMETCNQKEKKKQR